MSAKCQKRTSLDLRLCDSSANSLVWPTYTVCSQLYPRRLFPSCTVWKMILQLKLNSPGQRRATEAGSRGHLGDVEKV